MAVAAFPRLLMSCIAISASVLLFLSGCGSHPHVAGTVTYKDKNLTAGTVAFVGKDGKKHVAAILSDGSYKLIEPPVGQVKVGVEVRPIKLNIPGSTDKKGEKDPPSPIPERYADPNKSGLSTEIKEGSNTYDITLK